MNSPSQPVQQNPPARGPFFTAVAAAVMSAGLLIALLAISKLTVNAVLMVVVPVAAIADLLVAVSMCWIFILVGRFHRRPAWVAGTIVAIGVTMLMMLGIILLCIRGG
jgi:hypothetical protein